MAEIISAMSRLDLDGARDVSTTLAVKARHRRPDLGHPSARSRLCLGDLNAPRRHAAPPAATHGAVPRTGRQRRRRPGQLATSPAAPGPSRGWRGACRGAGGARRRGRRPRGRLRAAASGPRRGCRGGRGWCRATRRGTGRGSASCRRRASGRLARREWGLRPEDAAVRMGVRSRAVYSEHRVNARGYESSVCVSLVRVVIICPASTHTALVSSPSLAVLHTYYLPT